MVIWKANAPEKRLVCSGWLEDVDMENSSRKEHQALPYRRRISSKQLHLSNLLRWFQTRKVKSKEVLYNLLPSPLLPAKDYVVFSFLGYKQQLHCTIAACFLDKINFFLSNNL